MFADRKEAGRLLAVKLKKYQKEKNLLILGIPRGGVIVAVEVAKILKAPLDVLVIKKIGFPGEEEAALGAVSSESYYLIDDMESYNISNTYMQQQIKIKQKEVKERYKILRGKKPMYAVRNKTILLVDDGIAMGATMAAAIQVLRKEKPKKIIVAVPVAPPEAIQKLRKMADDIICLDQPLDFFGIGQFYKDFRQYTDEEIKELLT